MATRHEPMGAMRRANDVTATNKLAVAHARAMHQLGYSRNATEGRSIESRMRNKSRTSDAREKKTRTGRVKVK